MMDVLGRLLVYYFHSLWLCLASDNFNSTSSRNRWRTRLRSTMMSPTCFLYYLGNSAGTFWDFGTYLNIRKNLYSYIRIIQIYEYSNICICIFENIRVFEYVHVTFEVGIKNCHSLDAFKKYSYYLQLKRWSKSVIRSFKKFIRLQENRTHPPS